MQVKLFLVADYANVDSAGKLNILGVFTKIYCRSLPTEHQMHIVAQLSFDWSEGGQHRAAFIRFYDPDGKEKATIVGEFDVPKPKVADTTLINLVLGLRISLDTIGKHEIKLFVDKDYKDTLELDVVEASQQNESS